ncbi:hypothetical protein AB0D46_35295 [Streptomyces sp. NPDC048383]|uniref:hypothetical protein n=1 Tax=Streptomyces sp. NPDC048383 TaxID=3155386 RepID=UPI003431A515
MATLLLFLIPAGLIAPVVLAGFGLRALVRIGRGGASRHLWLRGSAAFLAAAAVALYTWGLLHLAGTVLDAEDGGTDSSPLRPCRVPGHPERAAEVVDYTVSYVPLRFLCEEKDGESYSAKSVPAYVNPAVLGFALAAVACVGAAATDSERRRLREGPETDHAGQP